MDIRRYRYQYSVVSAVILLIACGQSAFAQYISYQGPSQQSNPLDIASILQLIFKGQFYDKVGVSAEPTTTTTSTTTSTTKSVNLNNYLNGDGSVNRDRAGLLPSFLTTTTRSPAQDRAQGNTPSWLDILLRRFPTQTIKPQYRSYDEAETTEVTSASSTATTKKNNGALLVTNDAVFIFNSNSAKSTPQPNKESPTPNTKEIQVEVQDKPFTGVPKDFFDHKQRKRSAERDTDIRENKTEAPETHQTTGGLNCLALEQFAPCEYHRQCFSKNVESCQVRGSYIGDEADRLCQAAQKIVGSTQSEPLKSYIANLDECIKEELVAILESPSCDDVTLVLSDALLYSNQSSCLYLSGEVCDVINDPFARRDLALLFSEPSADQDFMMRLLITLLQLTSYCPGDSSKIFVTDVMMEVMSAQAKYKLPEPPVPKFS